MFKWLLGSKKKEKDKAIKDEIQEPSSSPGSPGLRISFNQNRTAITPPRNTRTSTLSPSSPFLQELVEGPDTPTARIKIIILGYKQTGKAELLKAYLKGNFIKHRLFKDPNDSVHKIIFEYEKISGNEQFNAGFYSRCRAAKAFIIVYDISNRESFEKTNAYNSEIRKCNFNKINIALVAAKVDLPPNNAMVTFSEGYEKKEVLDLDNHYRTSSIDGTSVNEIFDDIERLCFINYYIKYEADKEKEMRRKVKKERFIERHDEPAKYWSKRFLENITFLHILFIFVGFLSISSSPFRFVFIVLCCRSILYYYEQKTPAIDEVKVNNVNEKQKQEELEKIGYVKIRKQLRESPVSPEESIYQAFSKYIKSSFG